MVKILAIIPARSGSKRIKNKNIRLFQNKPLLAHSIIHSLKSKYIQRTIVSTDSPMYANIATKYGAEVPFLRPKYLSDSFVHIKSIINFFLDRLEKKKLLI